MTQFLSAFLGGAASIAIGAAVFGLWIRGLLMQIRDLGKEVTDLREVRMARLEVDLATKAGKGEVERLARDVGGAAAKTDVREVKDQHIGDLRRRMDAFEGKCVGTRVSTQLETVIAQNNEILRDIKQLNRESAEQAARIDEMDDHLKRLHSTVSKHTQNGRIHANAG